MIWAQNNEHTTLNIDTITPTAETDDNYICATIDWWPKEKCNYDMCPWGSSSALNLNLSYPSLNNAVRAFKNLRIRLGGSLQDQVIYGGGDSCQPFKKQKSGLFGFSKGCLPMQRWDELHDFFKKNGVLLTFGLNALHGRHHVKKSVYRGDWDQSNARDFIAYTISKGHPMDSWEFGNELCGKGVSASVDADQYAKDMIKLNAMIAELYGNNEQRPSLLAPGGFYEKSWFDKLLRVSGSNVVNALTHHIYNLGPGNDRNLVSKILNPDYLNQASLLFSNLSLTIRENGPWASAWVGEAGGIYNSGGKGVSNTFVNSFWYLDQLGMAAKYNTKVYCRQSLLGGFYGLLNMTTFIPNPDYYSALLWNRLMGKQVLNVKALSSPYLRAYAHCTKERAGVTLLLINLSNQTGYNIEVQSSNSADRLSMIKNINERSFTRILKESVSWVGNEASDGKLYREEYELTPQLGDIQSSVMLLNKQPLHLTKDGDIPSLVPILRDFTFPLRIEPLSIKFIVFPNFQLT